MFCCDDEFTEPRNTGSVTRRVSCNMKATLLSPPKKKEKKSVFCFVSLCFPQLAMPLFVQKHHFEQNQKRQKETRPEVCARQQQKIDFGVRQLS